MKKPFQKVAAAIIFDERGNILITQRMPESHLGGYWEFPGGKVEKDESAENALIRELEEETGLKICVERKFWEDTFDYGAKTVHLIFFICRLCPPAQSIEKREISDYRWIDKSAFGNYLFPPADSALIEILQQA